MSSRVPITNIEVSVFTIPTDFPESDGTFKWEKTTLVLVHAHAGGKVGIGYTYADESAAELIQSKLSDKVKNLDAMDVTMAWSKMTHSIRNLGRPGIASMAISAVDTALWDLKAKLLNLPLVKLFGQVHDGINIYGSGGFTSYSNKQLAEQLRGWVEQGIPRVKMKVGREPTADPDRVKAARKAIAEEADLYVDANGAYTRKQALQLAEIFANYGVKWLEEPVSSNDLEGLRLIRDRAPAGMNVAAGEYGFDSWYFRRMLEAGAVDFLQADTTRCAGFTGFLEAAALCEAYQIPLSGHCAPTLHVHVGCAAVPLRNLEYFHDHVRIENIMFDGVPQPKNGKLYPDLSRPGIGIELKRADAQRYAA